MTNIWHSSWHKRLIWHTFRVQNLGRCLKSSTDFFIIISYLFTAIFNNIFGTAIRYGLHCPGFYFWREKISLLIKILLRAPWIQPFSPGEKRPKMQLICHLKVVSGLRMNGALPFFSLYVFMTWPVTTLNFIFLLPTSNNVGLRNSYVFVFKASCPAYTLRSWFQTSAMSWMLYSFFRVNPRWNRVFRNVGTVVLLVLWLF
jgi:hypothetical protein